LQEAVIGHCSKCSDAEQRVRDVESQLTTLELALQNEQQICQAHQKYIDELETSLNASASNLSTQVCDGVELQVNLDYVAPLCWNNFGSSGRLDS